MQWYVAQAKDVDIARFYLTSGGYEVYTPNIEVRVKNGVKSAPMFGSYIFVHFDLVEDNWEEIWHTRGIRRIMCMDGVPSRVPERFVEELKAREVEGCFKVKDNAAVRVGDNLKILEGPLAGVEGICSFSTGKRVGILLHLLNRETRVYLSNSAVALVS